MLKKIILTIFLLALAVGAVWIFFKSQKRVNMTIENETAPAQEIVDIEGASKTSTEVSRKFFVAGWLPYWAKDEGAKSLEGNPNLFSQVNPFAFAVNSDGTLRDVMRLDQDPWPKLFDLAKKQNVEIVPTILWGDAKAMHRIFLDPNLLGSHVDAIAVMLEKNNFPGVDIDYEGKDIADKDNFSEFIKELKVKLSAQGKTLSCTIEARTQEAPPEGFEGVRAMSWANDFSVLGEQCDVIRIMAYDQVFQIHRANIFEDVGIVPVAANADNSWAQDNVNYALKYIPAEKLVLGIPTYGWEFKYQKTATGFQYTRVKSISFPDAMSEAQKAGTVPARNSGGEMSFIYKAVDGQHIVTFSDAEAVREKIEIAKQFNLKGVSLFKIDGLWDPEMVSILRVE